MLKHEIGQSWTTLARLLDGFTGTVSDSFSIELTKRLGPYFAFPVSFTCNPYKQGVGRSLLCPPMRARLGDPPLSFRPPPQFYAKSLYNCERGERYARVK
jgi:hypothetical protein